MRFRDSWFLLAGFVTLLLSASVLLASIVLKGRWTIRIGGTSFWELAPFMAGFGLQLGAVLMILGVTMALYRKAQLRQPRSH